MCRWCQKIKQKMRSSDKYEVVEEKAEVLPLAFQRLGTALHRMARTLMGNADDADDALQEAFCRLWPRRENIKSEEEAAKLLTTTVKHLSVDLLRQRQTRRAVTLDEERDAVPDLEDNLQECREEQYRRVKRLVEIKLTPLQREILHRREILGEAYEQIAADMKMQQSAIRTQLSRARKTIRECYKNNDL